MNEKMQQPIQQPMYGFVPPQPVIRPVKPPETFDLWDVVMAWMSIPLGYLFCRTFPLSDKPVAAFLFVVFVLGITVWAVSVHRIRISFGMVLCGLSVLIVSAAQLLTEGLFLRYLAYIYCLATCCYFLYAAMGNRSEKGFSDFILLDYFKAVFIAPFYSFGKVFVALKQGRGGSGLKVVLKALVGIVMTAIPTVIICILLMYDESFVDLLDTIFQWDSADVESQVYSIILAIPLGMYIFGLYRSSAKKTIQNRYTAAGYRRTMDKAGIIPQITVLFAGLPILILYTLFFISQWQYYVSAFTGSLPEQFSYAQYARQGFFELCIVSAINFVVILVLSLFVKKGAKNRSAVMKLLTVLFCVATLILICTAVSKLVLYISSYGLTHKRIYAMWFMTLIALVFILMVVGQFVPRTKAAAMSFVVCIVMFCALSLCNVSSLTAQYNVQRYLDGSLSTVDMQAMEELGDSAIPAVVELVQELDPETQTELYAAAQELLQNRAEQLRGDETGFWDFSVPEYAARQALHRWNVFQRKAP